MRSIFIGIAAMVACLSAGARGARTVYLDDERMERISIQPGRSVILNFPSRPTKVVVGNKGLFAVEYIENDLAIVAMRDSARSNLFVYLEGRRFGFDLRARGGNGDEIVLVRDSKERQVKAKVSR